MVRIAHLSDIHIQDSSSFSAFDIVSKRALGAMNLLFNRKKKHDSNLFVALCADIALTKPDEVVITGDITNLSLKSEFLQARRFMEAAQLDPIHTTVIPGNHDVYVRQAQKGRVFESFFKDYCSGDNVTHVPEGTFPFVRIRKEIALIGTSTAIPTPPFFAYGFLGDEQLKKLENTLANLSSFFRVLLIHHPPLAYREDFLRGLKDKEKLQQVLAKVGCELILHGHEHRDLQGSILGKQGPIPVFGVGSGTYTHPSLEKRARYHIYHIEKNNLVDIETRVHNPTLGCYVKMPNLFRISI